VSLAALAVAADVSGSVAPVGIRRPDEQLLAALRRGDEGAFSELVDRHQAALIRVARAYVHDPAIAEEVTQETWLAVLEGIHGFGGRSSLKTWIFAILCNRAKTRAARERRELPLSALADGDGPAVALERFLPADHPRYPLNWARPPDPWPDERLITRETIARVRLAVRMLPPAQQVVLGLRDVEGWQAAEVCDALAITAANERVLLHRARSRVRRELAGYFEST
jgi:RNA polymerase sigma-70 factor (ECF subfamily)